MKRAEIKADTAWRKSRLAVRLLIRKESRPLRPREQVSAGCLGAGRCVTHRRIGLRSCHAGHHLAPLY